MTALGDLARSLAERPRPVTLYGAPEGYEAAAIGDVVAEGHVLPWLHVCRDDGRMARFAAALKFFHPELDALFVSVDVFAVGARRAAADLGRTVPRDLKLATLLSDFLEQASVFKCDCRLVGEALHQADDGL